MVSSEYSRVLLFFSAQASPLFYFFPCVFCCIHCFSAPILWSVLWRTREFVEKLTKIMRYSSSQIKLWSSCDPLKLLLFTFSSWKKVFSGWLENQRNLGLAITLHNFCQTNDSFLFLQRFPTWRTCVVWSWTPTTFHPSNRSPSKWVDEKKKVEERYHA